MGGEPGTFAVLVGASSSDLRRTFHLTGEETSLPADADSTAARWLAHPVLGPRREARAGTGHVAMLDDPHTGETSRAIPRRLARFSGWAVDE